MDFVGGIGVGENGVDDFIGGPASVLAISAEESRDHLLREIFRIC